MTKNLGHGPQPEGTRRKFLFLLPAGVMVLRTTTGVNGDAWARDAVLEDV